jgi:putative peptidoglycan lipid II flippase
MRYSSNLAGLVAAGILLSRIAGLVRESIFAHFLGNSAAADAFKAGFRIPNILQNLFGEGVLSASFIPVYSKLLGEGDEQTADLLAWAVGAALALAVAIFVLLGVYAAPWMIDAIAPGFHGETRRLTIRLVQILFPGAGLLVMSAWCLGVLNSHHRFFASYAAPVGWNLVIIAALAWYGPRSTQERLAIDAAWASVGGAGLQILLQLPQMLPLMGRFRVSFRRVRRPLGEVMRNFGPVVMGRGVAQVSGYVDNLLASLLPTGAVAALNYAQILYILPVSLFGMSVAAAELPSMSRLTAAGSDGVAEVLRRRLDGGLRQIAFMIVPSCVAFILIGDRIVALLFQSGEFTRRDSLYVWATVAGMSIGMLSGARARLYISAFYALLDAKTPFRYGVVRVSLTFVFGYLCAIPLPHLIGVPQRWGVVGLTASAGLASWVEYAMLRRRLNQLIGWTGIQPRYLMRLWAMAIGAGGAALGAWYLIGSRGRLLALVVIAVFGVVYLGLAALVRDPELDRLKNYARGRLVAGRRD